MLIAEWQLGLVVSGVGCFSGTLGVQLRILALTYEGNKSLACHIAGWGLWLAGEGFKQLSIGLAPATLITCFSFSAAMLLNTLMAPFVLQEELTSMHAAGVALLCAGGSLVSVVASHGDQSYGWSDLCSFSSGGPFLITITLCLVLACALGYRAVRKGHLDVCTFAFLFSLSGAMDLLVTKLVLQLVRLHVVEGGDYDKVGPSFALPAGVVTLLIMHLVVFAFQLRSTGFGDALQNVPLFLGSGVMMQVIICGTCFGEFERTRQLLGFVSAFAFMLSGLFVISRAPQIASNYQPMDRELTSLELPAASSPTQIVRKGIISSGELGNLQSRKSLSDLFLVKDLQFSAVGFSEGHASQVAMDAMRSTASMAEVVVPSHVTHTLSDWLRPGPLRRDRTAPFSTQASRSEDVMVIQTLPSDCSLYDRVEADPSYNSAIGGVLVRQATSPAEARSAKFEANKSECSAHNRSTMPKLKTELNLADAFRCNSAGDEDSSRARARAHTCPDFNADRDGSHDDERTPLI